MEKEEVCGYELLLRVFEFPKASRMTRSIDATSLSTCGMVMRLLGMVFSFPEPYKSYAWKF